MADDKPLSRWARAHGKRPAPQPYVPKALEPEPETVVENYDDDRPLIDTEPSEAEKVQREIKDRGLEANVEIAHLVIQTLNNYKPKGA